MGMLNNATGSGQDTTSNAGYVQQFGAPGTLNDDDSEGDEEDFGANANQQQNALDYDSDEKDDEADGA